MNGKVKDLILTTYFRDETKSPFTVIEKMMSRKTCKILDMCTSSAMNIIPLATHKLECEVVGVEKESNRLGAVKHAVKRSGVNNITLRSVKGNRLPYDSESFDYVTLQFALSEKEEWEREELLTEAKRVVKKAGRIIICEWCAPDTLFRRIKFIPIKLAMQPEQRMFIAKDSKQYLKKFGLIGIKTRYVPYCKIIVCAKTNA